MFYSYIVQLHKLGKQMSEIMYGILLIRQWNFNLCMVSLIILDINLLWYLKNSFNIGWNCDLLLGQYSVLTRS